MPLQQHRIASHTVVLTNALAVTNESEASLLMQANARHVFCKSARLQQCPTHSLHRRSACSPDSGRV
jgi:hypothetical protein